MGPLLAVALLPSATHAAAPVADPRGSDTVVLDADNARADRDPTRSAGPGTYLVTLTGQPSAAYGGDISGFARTQPTNGRGFDHTRPAVSAYEQRLTEQQNSLLARIGDPPVLYRFATAANGFVAELNSRQVKYLRGADGVALVEESTKQKIDTVDSPEFLGLEGADGAWAVAGGPDGAGKGIVVGVIDTGIWPENSSFAGVPLRSPDRSEMTGSGFHGACAAGEQWTVNDCNDKVISARYFVRGFGQGNISQSEYLSPRDGSGHGSHTAAIAAGNDAVQVEIGNQDFGQSSGMAPGARIAAYKACWAAPNPEDDGCSTADTLAAINQAVADGVDVINYSISGSRYNVADSVERAFLNAAAAGVFVATSAGNGGPGSHSVGHPSPWVTTVAASTHQSFQGAVELGDGTSYVGAMASDAAVPDAPLVLASDAASSTATEDDARLCQSGALDAAKVQDMIVVCDRGDSARVDKSAAVARAGGAAMILVNVTPGSQDADFHSVPTVHVGGTDGQAIKEYVEEENGDATALLDPDASDGTAVPQVADFSSRGPTRAAGGNLLKPDLAAPGVSVVSAVAPPSNSGRLWDLYSGTSMSAPHIAGLAAFVQGVKPDWSPAQIKSAMMTTAYDVEGNDGAFSQGAGHVDPSELLDPGLVFDANEQDWRGFLRSQGVETTDGSAVEAISASDLNVPSIAVGDLAGRTTITRTVTNVSGKTESFSADVSGLDGVSATVAPDTLLLGPGESASFTVRLVVEEGAQLGSYAEGALTWSGLAGYDVHVPMVVRPQLLSAQPELAGTSTTGSVEVTGRSGSERPVELSTAGLVAAMPAPVSLVPGSFDPEAPEQDGDTLHTTIEVPGGTDVARFAMDAHNSADDMDVFVYSNDELVGSSASSAADETVTLVEPEGGEYDVYVSAFSADNGATTTGQLFTWVVGPGDAGNLTLEPSVIEMPIGSRFDFTASWSELDMTQRWFGAIRYAETDHRTFITVK